MNAHSPTGSHYAQSDHQYSQSSYQPQSAYPQSSTQYPQQSINQYQNSGMPAVQAPIPTGYQAPQQYQQYQPTQQAVSSNDDYLGYVVEQSQVNTNMPKRSHYGATANAGSVNINSFDDTDIQLDDGGNNAGTNAH